MLLLLQQRLVDQTETVGRRVGVGIGTGRRRRFAFAAPDRAEDESAPRQKRPAQQRSPARVTTKTAVRGVPVLAFVSHLTCCRKRELIRCLLRPRLFTEASIIHWPAVHTPIKSIVCARRDKKDENGRR